MIALLDHVFPEYQSLFSDTYGKTSFDLLLSHTTLEDILALDTDALTGILARFSRGRLGEKKPNRSSPPTPNPSASSSV